MNNGEKSQGRGFRRRQPILAVLRHLGATVYPLQVTEAFRATQGRVVPGSAFDRITSIEGLKAAWGTVLAKEAADGELRRQTIDVIGRLDEFIADLSKDLREGSYMPEPVHRFTIPKKIVGESRELQVPTVRDKIVERAVIESIGPAADRVQSSCSFAYRQGIGVPDAVQRIAAPQQGTPAPVPGEALACPTPFSASQPSGRRGTGSCFEPTSTIAFQTSPSTIRLRRSTGQ